MPHSKPIMVIPMGNEQQFFLFLANHEDQNATGVSHTRLGKDTSLVCESQLVIGDTLHGKETNPECGR